MGMGNVEGGKDLIIFNLKICNTKEIIFVA